MPIDYGSGIDFDYGTVQDSALPTPVPPDETAQQGDYADAKDTYEAIKNGIDLGSHFYMRVKESFRLEPGIMEFTKVDTDVIGLYDLAGREELNWSILDEDDVVFVVVPPLQGGINYFAAILSIRESFPDECTGWVITTHNYYDGPNLIQTEATSTATQDQVVSAKAMYDSYYGQMTLSQLTTNAKTIIAAINEVDASAGNLPTPVAPAENADGGYADAGYTWDQIQAATLWRNVFNRSGWNSGAQSISVLVGKINPNSMLWLRWYHFPSEDSADSSYAEAFILLNGNGQIGLSYWCPQENNAGVPNIRDIYLFNTTLLPNDDPRKSTTVDVYIQGYSARRRYTRIDAYQFWGTTAWEPITGTNAEVPAEAIRIVRTVANVFTTTNGQMMDLIDVYNLLPTKVDVQQGVENVRKVLGIGEDGNVLPVGPDAFEFVGVQADWDALSVDERKKYTKATIQGNVAPRDLEVLPATVAEIQAMIDASIAACNTEVYHNTFMTFQTTGVEIDATNVKYIIISVMRDIKNYSPITLDLRNIMYRTDDTYWTMSPLSVDYNNTYERSFGVLVQRTGNTLKLFGRKIKYRALPSPTDSNGWINESDAVMTASTVSIQTITLPILG